MSKDSESRRAGNVGHGQAEGWLTRVLRQSIWFADPAGVTYPEISDLWLLKSKDVCCRSVARVAFRTQQPDIKAIRKMAWLKLLSRKQLGLYWFLTKHAKRLLVFPRAKKERAIELLHAFERWTK